MTTTPTPTPAHDGGLLDAGLASVDTPADAPTDTVRARSYTHPALGDRPVVRIVPDALAPAEDAAVDFLGFSPGDVSAPLARTLPRGLGYPEWALIHDPGRRAQALALVRPMERAARLAATRPGRAEEEFAGIAADVPLSHLPAFWEQAGRAFLAAGNARTAGVAFGRAREAEQVYSLPVDEDTRREAFLEFALAGALTVKALAGHATELAGRYEPARAHAEFRELSLRRSLGGLPPWTGLPKQLRTLARAAGLDPAAEEADFLREVLDIPAASSAPEGFWKAVRPTLVAMGRADADTRRAMLGLFPAGSADFHDWWLAMLDDAGAVDLLADPREHVPGGAAAWFGRMVVHTRAMPDRLCGLVSRIADRLRADGVPVRIGSDGRRHRRPVRVDLLERCLELGVPVREPGEHDFLDLRADSCREEDGCALRAILADEHWEPVLARAVADYGGGYRCMLEDLLPSTCLHPYMDRRLGELVDASAQAGLARFGERLDLLTSQARGAVFAAFPHRRAELGALDPAEVLAATLRAGIVDEFGWPDLEEVMDELRGNAREPVAVTYSWPVLTVTSRARAVAVGPKGRVAEHELRLPSDARDPLAVYSDGEFLVCYRFARAYGEEHGYWSSDPQTRLDFPAYPGAAGEWRHHPSTDGIAQLASDGARMGGDRVLRRGERPGSGEDHLFHDGATFWRVRGGVPREVDPATGDSGRTSLPAFLEELPVADGETLLPLASTLAPLTDPAPGNPLGTAPGTYGFGVVAAGGPAGGHRVTAADGRVLTVHGGARLHGRARFHGGLSAPVAVFTAPGGTAHALRRDRGITLVAQDGTPVWSCDTGTVGGSRARWGTPFLPPPPYWSFMAPRDLPASRRLRAIGGADVLPLLEAAGRERREARGNTPETVAAATALLTADGGTQPDPSLVLGVAGLAVAVARRGHDLAAVVEAAEAALAAPDPEEGVGPDPEALTVALARFLRYERYRRPGDTATTTAHIDHASRFLSGRTSADEARVGPEPAVDWTPLLGRIGGLAWYAAQPTTPVEEREALMAFLDHWAGTVFADPDLALDTGVLSSRERPLPCARGGGRRLALGISGALPATWSGRGTGHAFVELRAGDPLPVEDDHTEHRRRGVDLTWGSGDQLRAFTRALAEHGPPAWDPGAVDVLAERTGLARAGAALLLAARLPAYDSPLDAHDREVLGLSAADVAIGAQELDQLGGMPGMLELHRSALPADPAAIGALWEPGGTTGLAERLADAWIAQHGRRTALPEQTLVAYRNARVTHRSGPDELRLLADPATDEALVRDTSSWIGTRTYSHRTTNVLTHSVGDADHLPATLALLTHAIAWAHAELPAGDPVREGIPEALRAVRARLAAPELLLPVAQVWSGPALDRWKETVGERPYLGRDGASAFPGSFDDGLVVAVDETEHRTDVWFRPAALGSDARSEVLRANTTDSGGWTYGPGLLPMVDLLRGPGFTAIAEQVASGGLAEGALPGDPAASVPALVEEAQGALGVSGDAARLYLQLLTLLEPTDRRVRSTNGWTPARHRKAQAELVAVELVMTAKRARSGRSVFLPGPWTDAKAPNLPLETWKLPLYDLRPHGASSAAGPLDRFLALRPLPEMFTEAWRRVREGDGPGR
ncbi:hypothetical protein ACFXKD_28695 [Nocardiopsis aegyptia]|uniref:hypothetical protein n=1 Tax=Nocardiopsis aegyptia TaxID=220378 RepID=UPI003671F2D7